MYNKDDEDAAADINLNCLKALCETKDFID
jgi:hypothetical protein